MPRVAALVVRDDRRPRQQGQEEQKDQQEKGAKSAITFHFSRFTFHFSRFTFHVSRFTFHVSRFSTRTISPGSAREVRSRLSGVTATTRSTTSA
jgi:hypothetical protein